MNKEKIIFSIKESIVNTIFYGVIIPYVIISKQNPSTTQIVPGLLICASIVFVLSFIWSYFFAYRLHLNLLKNKKQLSETKEFRCFNCEAIIDKEDNKCTNCGWTWKN